MASAVVITTGLVIRNVHIFGWDIELGLLAVPLTLFWLLGAINALNLIDGIDGLATSEAIVAGDLVSVIPSTLAGLRAEEARGDADARGHRH